MDIGEVQCAKVAWFCPVKIGTFFVFGFYLLTSCLPVGPVTLQVCLKSREMTSYQSEEISVRAEAVTQILLCAPESK